MNLLHFVRARGRLAALPVSAILGLAGAMIFGATTASAAVTSKTITSSPLSITITNDLNCQVAHTGDSTFEWYPPAEAVTGDCGTYLWVPALNGGQLFGPSTGHARTFTPTPWVPVSQTISGDGLTITTVVDTGAVNTPNCLLRVTQTDTYTPGSEKYRTTVAILVRPVTCTPTPAAQPAAASNAFSTTNILYRAGDCFLAANDSGYGVIAPTFGPAGSVYCRGANQDGSPGARLEGFEPVTAGSRFVEDNYATVWNDIKLQVQFPNTCTCDVNQDNGAGLSWNNANAGTTFVHDTVFSPLALQPSPTPTPAASAAAVALPRAGGIAGDSNKLAVLVATGIVVIALLLGAGALVRTRVR